MSKYGITDEGFVLKRLDVIMEEIHSDLSAGFGVDTRLTKPSFLDVTVTTFSNQIAELWETAQNQYYARLPSTATGVNLDNAVQYGGIRRKASKQTCYPLHCTGEDGTYVREGAIVATDTKPEIRLYSTDEFRITRDAFNEVVITVAAVTIGVYSVTINGDQYSYSSNAADKSTIISGLAAVIKNDDYTVTADGERLIISDNVKTRKNALILSDNLTTESVTSIANFYTEEYGKITLPEGIVTKMVNNIAGFDAVINLVEPIYGRNRETDAELRQSYIKKAALRSNTMLESIEAELLNNVDNVESAKGYENDTNYVDARGLPPHSIEIVVEGGDNAEIAAAILRRKAGGIQTYGSITVNVPGNYGDSIPISFNRPEYLYTWLKIVLHGDSGRLPTNFAQLAIDSVMNYGSGLIAGTSLLTQLLNQGIYDTVAGITYVDIYTAHSSDSTFVPEDEDYTLSNVVATARQKVLIDDTRIEVSFIADT